MALKKLTVIDTRAIAHSKDPAKDWTIYEVTAVDENGAPIEETLKSFDQLSGTVEVEVERQESAKYGVSFMLKLPRGAGGGGGGGAASPSPGARLGPKVDEIRGRVEHLEDQVRGLRQAIEELRGGVPVPTAQPTPVDPPASKFGGDDDVPF